MGIQWRKVVSDFILLRQDNKCPHCGETIRSCDIYDIDHTLPQASGGRDEMDNLQILHYKCHKAKHKHLAPYKKCVPVQQSFRTRYSSELLKEYHRLYMENSCNQSEGARALGCSERMLRYYIKRGGFAGIPVHEWTFPATQSSFVVGSIS